MTAQAPERAVAPRRGTLRGGEPVDRVPAQPRRADDPERPSVSPEELDEAARRAIEASPTPVLLAPGPWLEGLRILPLEHGYSLQAEHGATTLSLQSSARARIYRGLRGAPGEHPLRGLQGQITQNEGIRSASWIEAGVAFSADLECGDPTAPECRSEAGFVALLETLVFVEKTTNDPANPAPATATADADAQENHHR